MSFDNVPIEFEGIELEVTDGGTGVVIRHHAEADCEAATGCPFHAPSEHFMVEWPMTIHHGLILRICEHKRTHPDPDSVAFMEWMMPGTVVGEEYRQQCDGCCVEKLPPVSVYEMRKARKSLKQLERRLERGR